MPQSRQIVAESETATQAGLQSRLGRRPPMEARGLHGTAEPWIRRRTDAHPSPPAPAPAFVCFRGFRGRESVSQFSCHPLADDHTVPPSYRPTVLPSH